MTRQTDNDGVRQLHNEVWNILQLQTDDELTDIDLEVMARPAWGRPHGQVDRHLDWRIRESVTAEIRSEEK